jgi:DNA modification methylase/superfamily II DNA or RNA helicase
MTTAYTEFLQKKRAVHHASGTVVGDQDINPILFPFQRDLTRWAVRRGRCAIFADTGMGKTLMQLEWARLVGEPTLIIAPLSVARQTVREAEKIGIVVRYVREELDLQSDCQIHITNYEMFPNFDLSRFGAVVLDESSILKSISGQTRRRLTSLCQQIPYRLCCTATPAPNDYTEIGNHAEFLGICTMAEMLATYFVNANYEHTYIIAGKSYRRKGSNKGGQEWRLKHHAEQPFFRWMASWAITLIKPSDLGYDDDGFILPPLTIHPQFVPIEYVPDDQLLFTHLHGIADRADMRRRSLDARLQALADVIRDSGDQWIIWCGLDIESQAVTRMVGGREVKGSDSPDDKAQVFQDFQDGAFQFLVTKPKIGGFGMNFQNAHNMAFFGLNDSWETWYQCIRREWRYRQASPVDVHVIMSDLEAEIYHNVMRKDAMAARLRQGLVKQIRHYEEEELQMSGDTLSPVETRIESGQTWLAMLGDSCERMGEIADNSIDLSVYSPPFADLFTYTDSEHDLGNSRGWPEFFNHYAYIIKEVLRVTKPGRLTCVHTSDIPAMANRDGYIGIRDFPGEVIRAYEAGGWTFVGRAFVQKNPQAQAIRVKSKALLFVQLRKDSTASRPALVDQILLFKKPGENAIPVTPVEHGELDNETWINWAHGIWTGISETDTLQFYGARGEDDEKHICPLQLPVIERCIKLYSNPGETVLTPFGGIGSEGYMAVKLGRRAILIELKPEYFETLVKNLRNIETAQGMPDLFSWAASREAGTHNALAELPLFQNP